MAKKYKNETGFKPGPKKVTSIGSSVRTRKNHKKATKKKYRGQGRRRR